MILLGLFSVVEEVGIRLAALPCCVCFEKSRQNRVVIVYFENGSYTRPEVEPRAPVHVSVPAE